MFGRLNKTYLHNDGSNGQFTFCRSCFVDGRLVSMDVLGIGGGASLCSKRGRE